MSQSVKGSLLEAGANIIVGLGLSTVISIAVLSALGLPSPISTSLLLTSILTATSLARQFLIRRYFDGLSKSRE